MRLKLQLSILLGHLLSTSMTLLLLPELTWLKELEGLWSWGLIIQALLLSLFLLFWSSRTLARGKELSLELARDFPFKVARIAFLFAISIGLSSSILLLLRREDSLSEAAITGLISYLLYLVPTVGVYLLLRRLLKPQAQGPPRQGLRQSIALRLAFALQLPIVISATGMILIEQEGGERYERALEIYYRERYTDYLQRILQLMEREERQIQLLRRLEPPDGILLGLLEKPECKVVPTENITRPLHFQILAVLLLILVALLSTILGRWLARELTTELKEVGSGLRSLRETAELKARFSGVGFRESQELINAFEGAMRSFELRRRAMEQAARQRREAEELKARFLAHLSHELKSPLNSILGFSELLLTEIEGPLNAEQRQQLNTLWHSGESLLRLILCLLDLARLETSAQLKGGGLKSSLVAPEALWSSLEEQHRPDPLERLQLRIIQRGSAHVQMDPSLTARALLMAVGLLLDRMEWGEVELLIEGEEALRLEIRVKEAQAREEERLALHSRLSDSSTQPHFGAEGALRLLLETLVKAQGGRLGIYTETWPRFELHLPSAKESEDGEIG